jgi:hypothetical protein
MGRGEPPPEEVVLADTQLLKYAIKPEGTAG